MKKTFSWITIVIFIFVVALFLPFLGGVYFDLSGSPTEQAINSKLEKENGHKQCLSYNLLDPEQAPSGIHDTVMLGFHIISETPKYAADYVGDELSCTNCHFSAGNTTGGRNGSISLAGIAAAYPAYSGRSGKVITLPERINGCFQRSMNGKALPLDSREMDAMVTYLHWISKNFPVYQPVPWRGLEGIRSSREPDPALGEKTFQAKCALCHGKDGEGGIRIPPLWGPTSFNDGAGMNRIDTFAAFIYSNMPYEDPSLTKEEAYDVASYVTQKPRPKFED
ncbi:MAG: c-type cytochrome [Chlamydiota bacterium]|nr:c-type cytochrome [Chlamydiota bacterium]